MSLASFSPISTAFTSAYIIPSFRILLNPFLNNMMPGSKVFYPHELAHKWKKYLGTRPDMSIKAGCISHDMRILGRIVGVPSTEQSAGIIVGAFDPNIIIYIYSSGHTNR